MIPNTPTADIAARVCRLLAIAGLALNTCAAYAQYTDLHDFGGTAILTNGLPGPDGINPGNGEPDGGVALDSSGNLYGTASAGGLYGRGMVWELTAASGYTVYQDLHDFGGTVTNADGITGPDGEEPQSSVKFDSAGNMYGTTELGGPYYTIYGPAGGNVWELTAASGYTSYIDLHDFGGPMTLANGTPGTDTGGPNGVTLDANGNLYGTTPAYLWELTTGSVYTDLHDFDGQAVLSSSGSYVEDGADPVNGVAFDSAGNLYGVTFEGGPTTGEYLGNFTSGGGIVYELTAASGYTVYKDLHDFGETITTAGGQPGLDGFGPLSGVTVDSAGALYGTTNYGGGNFGANYAGIVWEITSSGQYVDLHDFGGTRPGNQPDGGGAQGAVTLDALGDIVGTTLLGGQQIAAPFGGTWTRGVLWELRPDGTYFLLHNFGLPITVSNGSPGLDGGYPLAPALDASGNIYGAAYDGGPNGPVEFGDGMAWKLNAPVLPALTPVITPAAGEYTTSVSVSIDEATPGAAIYYTTDGTDPRFSGSAQEYTDAINLAANATVRATAEISGVAPSPVASAAYVVRAADPTFSNNGQHIATAIDLTMSDATPNASIYYTLDGNAPNPGNADTFHYHGVPVVVEPGVTVEAIATIVGGHRSGTKIASFPANTPPPAPAFLNPGGTYISSVYLGLSDTDASVTIYYTTDGTTPSPGVGSTQQYTGEFSIAADTTVNTIAVDGAGQSSAVATAVYVVQAADPVITPGSEAISSAIDITISDVTPGASIYYTLDGSAPSPGAADTFHWHGTPVHVEPNTTVEAIATLAGGHRSNTVVDSYP